jgi:two-component system response regulator PilR (NtrC family)
VEKGKFREDLYYRLNVVHIHLPALRERREEIPLLVRHFIARYNRELGKRIAGVDNETMKLLLGHPWKGNVRELKNVVERAMIFCDGDTIEAGDLPPGLEEGRRALGPLARGDLRMAVKNFERLSLLAALEETGHDKKAAASLLGLSKSSFYRKLEELGIDASLGESRE